MPRSSKLRFFTLLMNQCSTPTCRNRNRNRDRNRQSFEHRPRFSATFFDMSFDLHPDCDFDFDRDFDCGRAHESTENLDLRLKSASFPPSHASQGIVRCRSSAFHSSLTRRNGALRWMHRHGAWPGPEVIRTPSGPFLPVLIPLRSARLPGPSALVRNKPRHGRQAEVRIAWSVRNPWFLKPSLAVAPKTVNPSARLFLE